MHLVFSGRDDAGLTLTHPDSNISGFGSARPYSIRARFWRPGTVAFYADSLETMNFDGMAGDAG